MTAIITELDDKKLQELEEKFDPEMRFRPVVPPALQIVKWLLIALSCFHYYTAGFGLLQETLQEEKAADEKLNKIALSAANPAAGGKAESAPAPRRASARATA